MTMGNIIVGLVILAILGLSIGKVVKEKKNGAKCIGCPHGGAKSNKNNCNCS
ncbi:FeoB-associated Cys-rich membrane protein [Senegalia massiliensis]|uniref:FeoB-associated Cys-rich membrane protein n=1 Tax=Senegalia massiliensis TaxID=1720316 RepID=UPI0010322F3C|nr:FeoB-associated Cys-rich membrane protein [Senegalia massiliensis]